MENPATGISTTGLCAASKKYLSCLLIGKTGIKPHFLTWDLLTTGKFNLPISKEAIENKLIQFEYENKRQRDFRLKKCSLIAIGILATLVTGYYYTLPLLGAAATFIGMSLAIAAALICSSIVFAFIREKLIDPIWIKTHSIEKEKCGPLITQKIKRPAATEIEKEETQPIINKPLTIENLRTEPNQINALTSETSTTSNNYSSRFSFFYKLTEHSKSKLSSMRPFHSI